MTKELSLEQKQELAAEADRLLEPGSMFNAIVTLLVGESVAQLVEADIGGLTATAAHARIKALEDIKGRLRILKNDATMAEHRNKANEQRD